jgi:hypothetical protein
MLHPWKLKIQQKWYELYNCGMGYVWSFIMLCIAGDGITELVCKCRDKIAAILVKLESSHVPRSQLWTDNFCNAQELAQPLILKVTGLAGTLHANRKNIPPLVGGPNKRNKNKGKQSVQPSSDVEIMAWRATPQMKLVCQ